MEGAQLRPRDRLKTYQPAVVQQLCNPANLRDHAVDAQVASSTPRDGGLQVSNWAQRKAAQRAALELRARQKEERFKAAMERKRAADAAAREAHFQQLYAEVLGGLENETGVIADAQEVLDFAAAAQHTRKEALCKQWHSQVFEPMQERLHAAMAKSSIQQLESALQAASSAYVQATSTKRLFLDVVMEDDYNPLAPLENTIRIPTSDLVDPLLHDLVKTHAENKLLAPTCASTTRTCAGTGRTSSQQHHTAAQTCAGKNNTVQLASIRRHGAADDTCCFGLAKATSRPMLNTQHWAAGQIHATPYGHCINDVTAEYVVRPAPPLSMAQKASHVFFDDFSLST